MECVCWTATSHDATQATKIRRSLVRYLKERIRESKPLLEAEIVIGELLANAFRHSPGPVCADVEWRDDDRPILKVHDSGRCFKAPGPAELLAESGRGLQIVRGLADDVRIEPVEPRGCVVSATLWLTKHPDARKEPTVCPRGERRWELGCACALAVHGLDAATVKA
jgi:serine/threonine-protein kinase RsbW